MRISDWSSDVCSSDLEHLYARFPLRQLNRKLGHGDIMMTAFVQFGITHILDAKHLRLAGLYDCLGRKNNKITGILASPPGRSEESRVGKEGVSRGRSRWSTDH